MRFLKTIYAFSHIGIDAFMKKRYMRLSKLIHGLLNVIHAFLKNDICVLKHGYRCVYEKTIYAFIISLKMRFSEGPNIRFYKKTYI